MLVFCIIIYGRGEAFSFFFQVDQEGHMIRHCPRELPTRNKLR